ncbi:hypothetical protein ACFXD5_22700 [Streptomyces sp. NPDC059385]|uniref:hypothetical protein n=1 Tax=Streptomyces sp. NPDC059385 TaxID=3346817 RepID=UPI0036CD94B8
MNAPLTRSTVSLALAALALAALTACSGSSGSAGGAAADAQPAAASAAPAALPAPRSAPAPAPSLAAPPRQGEVRVEQGPFNDRVQLTRLTLTGGPAVTGHLAITSDVSDVLALEVRAAYYDIQGRLLGTGSFHYQEEGEDAHGAAHHDGARATGDGIDFTVPAEHLTGTPAAAVLSIPVLVNE